MSGRLYIIQVELEESEKIEVEACENGFKCERDSKSYSSYTLPGLLS
jgi:hypothetical protein